MKKSLVANLYNPHEQNKEQLIASFVVRHPVFQELFQAIRAANPDLPGPHYLIEGQRGMGKTTLLLRLSYEIENDPKLRSWLLPVVLKEEAYYGIRRLCALWETLAQELEAKDKSFAGLSARMGAAYEERAEYESACFELLVEALEQQGQKILLCIDNLSELLLNFTDHEQRRFYDILSQSVHLRLVGATPVVFDAVLPANHLFSDIFTTIRLEGLTKDETRQLLLDLAKVYRQERAIRSILKRQPGRVEALRLLTGGVIRTIVLLFEILTEQETGSSITDLDNILDRVTPLYQSRMQDLTPLQRDVVHAMALNWEAISLTELSRKTRLSQDEVAMALAELEKVFIVQAVGNEAAMAYYRLQERFFNIWYLMRLAPGTNRSKVLWLLHFLESWYDHDELTQRAKQHAEAVAAGKYASKEAFYLTEAFANTGKLDMETEHYLIAETRRLLQDLDAPLAHELTPSDKELFEQAQAAMQRGDHPQALQSYLEIKHKDDRMHVAIGELYAQLGRYQEAADALTNAAESGRADTMVQLGLIYQNHLQQYSLAEQWYLRAVELGNIEAMLHVGKLYATALNDTTRAERYFLQAIKEGQVHATVLSSGKFSVKALRNYLLTAIRGETQTTEQPRSQNFTGTQAQGVQIFQKVAAEAAFQLGNLYLNVTKNLEQAEKYYAQAVASGHVNAMVNLGYLYQYHLKNPQQAVKYYTQAIEHGETTYAPANLGTVYQLELKDLAQAEKYYQMAAEHGDVGAMNSLAWLYFDQKRNKRDALAYAMQAVTQERNMYTAHTAACVYVWNNRVEHAMDVAREFLYDEEAYSVLEQDILFFLMFLLARQHYQEVHDYFAAPEMIFPERFQPLYYAFLKLTENASYHKMPPELADPVDDILKQIEALAAAYA